MNPTYQFGEFALQPQERRLLCEGKTIALTPKVFDTLVLLVECAGHVAKKEDLLKALWPRGYVDEATLSNHIWQIRRALGDSAKTTRFIETVPKVGYRFVAPVTIVEAAVGAPAASQVSTVAAGAAAESQVRPRKRPTTLVGIIALGLAAIALVPAVLRHFRTAPSPDSAVTRSPSTRVVALVGFNNLTRFATDAWLAPALTTMIGTELATADEIRIVPYALVRDATQGLEPPIAGGFARETLTQLRKRLDADYIISGSYLVGTQADDPSLRIDVALQDARTGSLVAVVSNQTGLSELNRIIDQTGATLRGKLGVTVPNATTLSSVAKAQPPTTDVARHVALALDDMERHDAARARDELLEAVAQSPGFAPAYLYLSQAWSDLGYRQKALAAADQASIRAAMLPAEQRLQIKAAVQTAAYQWKDASTTWKELVAVKPVSVEYRIGWIDALIAAGEPKPAQTALAELLHLPRSAGDPRVSLVAARLDEMRSDTTAAVQDATAALRASQLREAPGLIADSEVELATAQMRGGKYEDARKELDAAIVGYQALDNPRGEVAARRALASTYSTLQRRQDAREEYQRAMALAQSIGDIGGVADVYKDICSMLWFAGDRDGAQAAARRALQISRDTGDLRLQAWTLRAVATIESDEADTDEVIDEYRQVTALTEQSHDAGGHVWSLASNADLLRIRGQLAEAQTDCSRAQSEAAALSDPQFTVYSSFTCALLAIDQGDNDNARATLERVVRIAQTNRDTTTEANAQMVLGQLDFEGAHFAQAKARLERASQSFAIDEAQTGEADAQALLALCAQALGDSATRDRASARAAFLRASITSRQEIFGVDIALARLSSGGSRQRADAEARLQALAADAERRHWLSWSLEAGLAQWQLLMLDGNATAAARLRTNLEGIARKHGFKRVIARLSSPS